MWKLPKMSFAGTNEDASDEKNDDEDEDDYMSDAFLSKCASSNNDIRPGIPMTYSKKRELKLEKKKSQLKAELSLKSKKVTQKERIEEGLSTALGKDNKGFSMLQKMGYKPGTSLGKEGSGQLEPIRVEVKHDRGGLGLKEMLMERKREKERRYLARIKKQNAEFDPNKYREQKRQQMMAKQMEADLKKCQRTCHSLDTEKDITEPMDWYFWPDYLLPKEEEEDYTEYDKDHEDNEDDKEDSKGKTIEIIAAHNNEDPWYEEDDYITGSGGDKEEVEPWQTEIQVDVVSTYLRTAYHYCIWCGTAYEDQLDLDRSCPGTTRQDHDD